MKPKSKTRRSFRQMFWKNHKVIGITRNGKIVRLYGKRFPTKTVRELIDE